MDRRGGPDGIPGAHRSRILQRAVARASCGVVWRGGLPSLRRITYAAGGIALLLAGQDRQYSSRQGWEWLHPLYGACRPPDGRVIGWVSLH